MKKITERAHFCLFCRKLRVNEKYPIYRLEFKTNLTSYTIGLTTILEPLADFLMDKGIHLSASQVVLLRPDILLEYLEKKYNTKKEQISVYGLLKVDICLDCYEEYIKTVPVR